MSFFFCSARNIDSFGNYSKCEKSNSHRCQNEIWDKVKNFKRSFYDNYYQQLLKDKVNVSIEIILKFRICPNGNVLDAAVIDKKNIYNDNFDKLLIQEFYRINFCNKKKMKDTIDCSLPIVFP